jgi:hypothetical protein
MESHVDRIVASDRPGILNLKDDKRWEYRGAAGKKILRLLMLFSCLICKENIQKNKHFNWFIFTGVSFWGKREYCSCLRTDLPEIGKINWKRNGMYSVTL